jgi:hypothetical protein
VTVTRRHHPLQGQSLEVVKRGRTQIVVRLGNGTSMRMPSTWQTRMANQVVPQTSAHTA